MLKGVAVAELKLLQLKLPPTNETEGAFTAKLVEAIQPSGKKAIANTVPELE